ncbi:hypothetical protein [Legionella fairfieldensis]|uniref:hypothetical protein n=1 Tax=Legionella fairfieldensis TaxID=45064 RepID=UPI00048D5FB3|nr:hypothetical protein [Legionella fairfieldensis]
MKDAYFEILQKGFLSKINVIHISMAFLALVSMLPYFTWKHQTLYFCFSAGAVIVSYFYSKAYNNFDNFNLYSALFFCLFLLYLSCLWTSVHTHKTWYLLIPSMLVLFNLSARDKILAMKVFSFLFAISLVPSIIIWLLMLMAIPLNFNHLEANSIFKIQQNVYYLHYAGSVFQSNTINLLPYGGKLARLVGIYDEPGTVGTFAALFLTVSCFEIKKKWKNVLILTGGILSFSLAFYLMSLTACCLLKKFKMMVLLGLTGALCFVMPYSPLHTRPVPLVQIENNIKKNYNTEKIDLAKKINHYLQVKKVIEYIKQLDNRDSPKMQALFSNYLHGSIGTILFGISSDANSVYDGFSSTWKIILTNYGLTGFVYLLLFLFLYTFVNAGKLKNKREIYTFLLVFIINLYQRPFIWIPSYMLIFVGAIAWFSLRENEAKPNQCRMALKSDSEEVENRIAL